MELTACPIYPRPQMLSLRPSDIVSKLKSLFAVVILIFGTMHIAGAVLYAGDKQKTHHLLGDLQRHSIGFRKEENGAWTWDIARAEAEHSASAAGGVRDHPVGGGSVVAGLPRMSLHASLGGTAAQAASTPRTAAQHVQQVSVVPHVLPRIRRAGGVTPPATATRPVAAAAADRPGRNVDHNDPLTVLEGPFAEFARILGLPAARLRLALPTEIFHGDVRARPALSAPTNRLCRTPKVFFDALLLPPWLRCAALKSPHGWQLNSSS